MNAGDCMTKIKLVGGKIPAHVPCPHKDECRSDKDGTCGHKGIDHSVPYSCGFARLFELFAK
jgi:hypothetical protein